jgi:hypothetical protein
VVLRIPPDIPQNLLAAPGLSRTTLDSECSKIMALDDPLDAIEQCWKMKWCPGAESNHFEMKLKYMEKLYFLSAIG